MRLHARFATGSNRVVSLTSAAGGGVVKSCCRVTSGLSYLNRIVKLQCSMGAGARAEDNDYARPHWVERSREEGDDIDILFRALLTSLADRGYIPGQMTNPPRAATNPECYHSQCWIPFVMGYANNTMMEGYTSKSALH